MKQKSDLKRAEIEKIKKAADKTKPSNMFIYLFTFLGGGHEILRTRLIRMCLPTKNSNFTKGSL